MVIKVQDKEFFDYGAAIDLTLLGYLSIGNLNSDNKPVTISIITATRNLVSF